MLQLVESHNLLEVVEHGITLLGVREVGQRRRSWPRDYGNEEDPDEDGTTNTVEHQEDGEEPLG